MPYRANKAFKVTYTGHKTLLSNPPSFPSSSLILFFIRQNCLLLFFYRKNTEKRRKRRGYICRKSPVFKALRLWEPSSFLSLPNSLFRRKKGKIQASKVIDYYGSFYVIRLPLKTENLLIKKKKRFCC